MSHGKASRKKNIEKRRAEKKARKLANYLRAGAKKKTNLNSKKGSQLRSRNAGRIVLAKPNAKNSRKQRKNGKHWRVGGKRK